MPDHFKQKYSKNSKQCQSDAWCILMMFRIRAVPTPVEHRESTVPRPHRRQWPHTAHCNRQKHPMGSFGSEQEPDCYFKFVDCWVKTEDRRIRQ